VEGAFIECFVTIAAVIAVVVVTKQKIHKRLNKNSISPFPL